MPGSQLEVNDMKAKFENGKSHQPHTNNWTLHICWWIQVPVTMVISDEPSRRGLSSSRNYNIIIFLCLFDLGEDPLPDLGPKGDVHLVASVLKAYFRELPEPLFPPNMTTQFMDAVSEYF